MNDGPPSPPGRGSARPIRVLVVEDSPATRDLLVGLLRRDGQFTVVGTAEDGEEAVALAARHKPDVITMDLHLPRLDGVAATRRIMADTPTPVVIISASAKVRDVGPAFDAMRAGAVALLDKPPGPGHPRHSAAVRELLTTVRLMADVKVVRRWLSSHPPPAAPRPGAVPLQATGSPVPPSIPLELIAIAASTGGPPAIQTVLQALGPGLAVPVLVVQHISHGFCEGLAAWLSATCPQPVRLAAHGEAPAAGTVYLAPEARHLLVTRRRSLTLSGAPPVGGFRPSADVLLESVAESYGPRALGVVLTGMGDDGAAGLAALAATGAHTIAQDEATSVVYGMPRAAALAGAAREVLALPAIGSAIRRRLEPAKTPAPAPAAPHLHHAATGKKAP